MHSSEDLTVVRSDRWNADSDTPDFTWPTIPNDEVWAVYVEHIEHSAHEQLPLVYFRGSAVNNAAHGSYNTAHSNSQRIVLEFKEGIQIILGRTSGREMLVSASADGTGPGDPPNPPGAYDFRRLVLYRVNEPSLVLDGQVSTTSQAALDEKADLDLGNISLDSTEQGDAQTALGLGTAATRNTGAGENNIPLLNSSGELESARLGSGDTVGDVLTRTATGQEFATSVIPYRGDYSATTTYYFGDYVRVSPVYWMSISDNHSGNTPVAGSVHWDEITGLIPEPTTSHYGRGLQVDSSGDYILSQGQYRAAYAAAVTYAQGDTVYHSNTFWKSLTANNTGNEPSVDSTEWERDSGFEGAVTHIESGATYNSNIITVSTTGTVRGGDGILFTVPSPFGTSTTQAVSLAIDGQASSEHPLHDRNGDAIHEADLTANSVYIAISDASSWDILVLPSGDGGPFDLHEEVSDYIGNNGVSLTDRVVVSNEGESGEPTQYAQVYDILLELFDLLELPESLADDDRIIIGNASSNYLNKLSQMSVSDFKDAVADGGGTTVTANPSGTDGDDLTRIAISGTNYNLSSGISWGFQIDTVIVPELNQNAITTARIVLEDSGLTHYLAFLGWAQTNLDMISHLPVGAHIGLRQGTTIRILSVEAEWDSTNNRYQVINVNTGILTEAASGTATELLLTAGVGSGLSTVATDDSITGDGTSGDPLSVADLHVLDRPKQVVSIPSTFDEALLYLTHDELASGGTAAHETITVGEDDGAFGYSDGTALPVTLGSTTGSSPVAFITGDGAESGGTITSFTPDVVGSHHRNFMDTETTIVIDGTDYAFGDVEFLFGAYRRSITSPPTITDGNFTYNFKDADDNLYFTDADAANEAGLWQWEEDLDPAAYARVGSSSGTGAGTGAVTLTPRTEAAHNFSFTGTIQSGQDRVLFDTNITLPTDLADDAAFIVRITATHGSAEMVLTRELLEELVAVAPVTWSISASGTSAINRGATQNAYFIPIGQNRGTYIGRSNEDPLRLLWGYSHDGSVGLDMQLMTLTAAASSTESGEESPGTEGVAQLTAGLVRTTFYAYATSAKDAPTSSWRFDDEWSGDAPGTEGWYTSEADALTNAELDPDFATSGYYLQIATEQVRRRVVNEAYSYTDSGWTVTAAWDVQYSTNGSESHETYSSENDNYVRYRDEDGVLGPWLPIGTSIINNNFEPKITGANVYPANQAFDSLVFVEDMSQVVEVLFEVTGFRNVTVTVDGESVVQRHEGPYHTFVLHRFGGWPTVISGGSGDNNTPDASTFQFKYLSTDGLTIWQRGDAINPNVVSFIQGNAVPPTQYGGMFKLVSTDGEEDDVTSIRFFNWSDSFARGSWTIKVRYI